MDINLDSKIGSPTKNVIIETAGRIYIKVGDRLYELDFRNQGKNSSSSSSHSSPIDTSNLVSKEELKSALSSYVTEKTWKSAKATQEAISAVNIPEFKESIDPITVNTMEMLVGAEQLQYDFVNTLGYYTEDENGMPTLEGLSRVVANIPYFQDDCALVCPPGIIKHYVYGGPEAVQDGIQDYQYCRWIVSGEDFNSENDGLDFVKYRNGSTEGTNMTLEECGYNLESYHDFILPNKDIFYLYIKAEIINTSIETEDWLSENEEEFLKKEILNSDGNLPEQFTYSDLLKIYEAIIAIKKSTNDVANGFKSLEIKVLNALYNSKIGKAKYFLSEIPLSLVEYATDNSNVPLNYNFLYAIIGNSGSSGRTITTLNGFTEITPGQVTAYIFKTPDGQQYINFKEGSIHIGQPYLNKEAEWMHYSEEKGLEISGKVTVTGGALKDEIEEITRLANGEYQVWYSDGAPQIGEYAGGGEFSVGGQDSYEVFYTYTDEAVKVEMGYENGKLFQYLPYPNDNDNTSLSKINWPHCVWQETGTLENHIGDLYIVSKDDPSTVSEVEQNTSYRFRKKEQSNGTFKYYWTRLNDSDLGIILNNIGNLEYLKVALPESTTIAGGLILSSTIALGYTKNGSRIDTAGINGAIPLNSENEYDERAIAAWFGGGMYDPEVSYGENEHPSYPAILFRHDGSGYIGGVSGSENVPALSWDSSSIKIRGDIMITDTNGIGIGTLGSYNSYFEEEIYFTNNPNTFYPVKRVASSGEASNEVRRLESGGYYLVNSSDLYNYTYNSTTHEAIPGTVISSDSYNFVLKLKGSYAGLYTQGFVSAFGASPSQGSSGGDASWPEDPRNGYLLSWNDSASEPIWLDPSTLGLKGLTVDSPTSSDNGKALIYDSSSNKWTLGSVTPSISLTLWGNSISNNTNTNGNSLSHVGGIVFEPDGNNNSASITPDGDTITINGNVIVTGYISAFGSSSSQGGDSTDASEINGIAINTGDSSWNSPSNGDVLTYNSTGWILTTPFSLPSGYDRGYALGMNNGSAAWIDYIASSFHADEADQLTDERYLWGQPFNGVSDIGDENDPADLFYVGDINFGDNSVKLSLTQWGSLPATNNTLYVYGNIVASGYISAFGSSGSSGGSGSDATSIDGDDIVITNLSSNQILLFNGTNWVNSNVPQSVSITLNGSATTSPSFYAPTGVGSSGKVIGWSNNAPSWIDISSLAVGSLANSVSLWGNSFDGSSSIGTNLAAATLNYVNQINFGTNSSVSIAPGAISSPSHASNYLGIDGILDVSGGLRLANNKYITFKRSNGDNIPLIRVNNMGESSSHNNQILFGGADIISMDLRAYFTFTELQFETGGGQNNTAKSALLLSGGNVYLYNQLKSWYNSQERVIMRMAPNQGVEFGDSTLAAKVTGSSVRMGSTYALSIGSDGVITIDGNKVILGATTNNPGYYFEIKTSGGSTYLETNLPIVSTSYISAFGQSGSQSYDEGGEDPGEDPGENPGEEPGEDPEAQNS